MVYLEGVPYRILSQVKKYLKFIIINSMDILMHHHQIFDYFEMVASYRILFPVKVLSIN